MKIYPLVIGLAVIASATHAQAQVSAGETYFKQNCASCHTVTPNAAPSAGPGLFGVVGRKVGGADFGYSDALTKAHAAGTVWTQESLDTFLADPQKAMPGTYMPVSITDKTSRAQLIAYLASLKDAPKSVPAPVAAAKARAAPTGEVWTDDKPGKVHHIVFADLPAPFAVPSAGNSPKVSPRPEGALPTVPAGFTISEYVKDPDHGRLLLVAPNGDIFLSVPSKA